MAEINLSHSEYTWCNTTKKKKKKQSWKKTRLYIFIVEIIASYCLIWVCFSVLIVHSVVPDNKKDWFVFFV